MVWVLERDRIRVEEQVRKLFAEVQLRILLHLLHSPFLHNHHLLLEIFRLFKNLFD